MRICLGSFSSLSTSKLNETPHVLLFSNKKNANKFKGQTLLRKLLGLIVHDLCLLPVNVFQSGVYLHVSVQVFLRSSVYSPFQSSVYQVVYHSLESGIPFFIGYPNTCT